MPKPLAVQLYTFRDPARFGGAGLGLDPDDARGDRRDRLPRGRDGRRARRRPAWPRDATLEARRARGHELAHVGQHRRPRGVRARRRPASPSSASRPIIVSGSGFDLGRRGRGLRRPTERRGRGRRRGMACRSATTTTTPRCAPVDGDPGVSPAGRARSTRRSSSRSTSSGSSSAAPMPAAVIARARRRGSCRSTSRTASTSRATPTAASRSSTCRSATGSSTSPPAVAAAETLPGHRVARSSSSTTSTGSPIEAVARSYAQPHRARSRPGSGGVTATRPARVGIVGCGDVTGLYLPGCAAFPVIELAACADLDAGARRRPVGAGRVPGDVRRGAARRPVDRGRAQPDAADGPRRRSRGRRSPPASTSTRRSRSPRPATTRATILAAADAAGVRVGGAPDTFLGGGLQTARAVHRRRRRSASRSLANAAVAPPGPGALAPEPGVLLRPRRRPAARRRAVLRRGAGQPARADRRAWRRSRAASAASGGSRRGRARARRSRSRRRPRSIAALHASPRGRSAGSWRRSMSSRAPRRTSRSTGRRVRSSSAIPNWFDGAVRRRRHRRRRVGRTCRCGPDGGDRSRGRARRHDRGDPRRPAGAGVRRASRSTCSTCCSRRRRRRPTGADGRDREHLRAPGGRLPEPRPSRRSVSSSRSMSSSVER